MARRMRFALPCLVQNAKTTVECTHGKNSICMFEGRPKKLERRGNHPSIINKCCSDRILNIPMADCCILSFKPHGEGLYASVLR
jgi:hypothetical protein